jgi:hypothetical protein
LKDEQHDLLFRMMGRQGGIHGSKLTEDIATGRRANRPYEIKESSDIRPNWFPISDFVNRVQTSRHKD